MLLFKKTFYDAIAGGTKTTTLRYWRHRRVKPGSVHSVRGLGRIRVESVEQVSPADLTKEHARADGFATLADLLAALEQMYGGDPQAEGRRLYLVRFEYVGQTDKPSDSPPVITLRRTAGPCPRRIRSAHPSVPRRSAGPAPRRRPAR
jgi:hypothetical protein